MTAFNLNETHIRNGKLSDEDLTAFAGYKVYSYNLYDLCHSDELRAGHKLNEQQKQARTTQLETQLREAGLPAGLFTRRDVYNMANKNSPGVSLAFLPVASIERRDQEHFRLIRELGADNAAPLLAGQFATLSSQNKDNDGATKARCIYPGTYGEEAERHDLQMSVTSVYTRCESKSAHAYWAELSTLPPDLVTLYPDDGLHNLATELHEQGHLPQIVNCADERLDYYRELAAELHSNSALRRAGVGQTTREGRLNARYLSTFSTLPINWYAPALEALEARQEPPTRGQIVDAISEIHARLSFEDHGLPQSRYTSPQIQAAAAALDARGAPIQNWPDAEAVMDHIRDGHYFCARLIKESPHKLFASLRQMVDSGVYTETLSRQIAGRILDAAEYFSPDISFGTKPNPKAERGSFMSPKALYAPVFA